MAQRYNKAGRSVSMYRKKGLGVGDWESRTSVGEVLTTVGEKTLDLLATPVRAPIGGAALAIKDGIVKSRKKNLVVAAATFALVTALAFVPRVIQSAFKSNEEVITEIVEGDEKMPDRPGATID